VQRSGRVLSQVDMMLAALARQMGLILLSSDRDFEDLPGLSVENWLDS
jgi:predicted nucleic acid-binding protein